MVPLLEMIMRQVAKTPTGRRQNEAGIPEREQPNIDNAAQILRDIAEMFATKYGTTPEDLLRQALKSAGTCVGLHPERLKSTAVALQDGSPTRLSRYPRRVAADPRAADARSEEHNAIDPGRQ